MNSALYSARYILEDLNHSEGIKKLSEISGLPEGVVFEAFKNIFPENEKEQRVYRYLVNSEIKEFSEPLYWYKWSHGGERTLFGGVYTETAFLAKKTIEEFENPNCLFSDILRQPLIEAE